MTDNSCLACDVVKKIVIPPGGVIFENDLITISHAVPPCRHKGFMIVSPKRHSEHIALLSKAEMHSITDGIHAVSQAITETLHPTKIYVCSFGETVKHVHFYVIPRYTDMPASGITVLTEILREQKWQCSEEEAKKTALTIQSVLPRFL